MDVGFHPSGVQKPQIVPFSIQKQATVLKPPRLPKRAKTFTYLVENLFGGSWTPLWSVDDNCQQFIGSGQFFQAIFLRLFFFLFCDVYFSTPMHWCIFHANLTAYSAIATFIAPGEAMFNKCFDRNVYLQLN